MLQQNLRAELRAGHVHRADLIDRGWRPDAIRRAAAREGLEIVRRMWIVAHDAAPQIRAAARSGGILSCISACSLAGLWTPGQDDTLHISAHPHSGRSFADVRVHRATGILPRPRRRLVDHPVNALALVATCVPYLEALTVWESAVRKGVVRGDQLRAIPWRGDRARRLARDASPSSDSGLETLFVAGMRRHGVIVAQQVVIAGRAVDGLVGEALIVQIDGFEFHGDAAQRRADIAHDRALRLLGYTVFRFDYRQIVHEWPRVEADVLAALTRGLHLRRAGTPPLARA